MTPAAVKQLVTKLESTLGVSLIVREGQKLYLTGAGRLGQASLTEGLSQLSMAVDKMRPVSTRTRLTISAEPFFASSWLVPHLSRFKDLHSNIDVLVDSSMRVVDLERGDADIAIRYGVETDTKLVNFRLFEDQIFPVCSHRLVEESPHLRQVSDLSQATLLHWNLSDIPWARSTSYWFNFSNWLNLVGAKDVGGAQNLYFSDYNQAIQAAIAGQGVVLGSWPILRDTVDAGLLTIPFEESVSTDIGYDMVMTRRAMEIPRIAEFKSWLLGEAKAQPNRTNNMTSA